MRKSIRKFIRIAKTKWKENKYLILNVAILSWKQTKQKPNEFLILWMSNNNFEIDLYKKHIYELFIFFVKSLKTNLKIFLSNVDYSTDLWVIISNLWKLLCFWFGLVFIADSERSTVRFDLEYMLTISDIALIDLWWKIHR